MYVCGVINLCVWFNFEGMIGCGLGGIIGCGLQSIIGCGSEGIVECGHERIIGCGLFSPSHHTVDSLNP